jgi:hypothetical protein
MNVGQCSLVFIAVTESSELIMRSLRVVLHPRNALHGRLQIGAWVPNAKLGP